MLTVKLGRTGAEVSVAGLGCGGASRLGMARGADVEQAAGGVRRAIELGVTFIDTARNYGTEEAVGAGIRGRRHEVFISTKSSAGRGEQGYQPEQKFAHPAGSLRDGIGQGGPIRPCDEGNYTSFRE